MEIRITKKQNMVVDGVKYKAYVAQDSCVGCAFHGGKYTGACREAPCIRDMRGDKRSVIFIKKKDLK